MQMERYSWATQLIHSNSEGLFVVVVVLSLYFGRSESIFVHVLKCFSRAGAGTLQPTICAVKLIHYEDENPNLNILAGAGPSSAWAGSRPDCGIGAAICHRCHLNACYGDE